MKNNFITYTAISISMLAITSFVIIFTALSDKTEIALATTDNNQTTQLVTQEKEADKKIVQQGVITSTPDPLPGHEAHQSVTILRLKADNTIYDGTLSFVASKPVEVQILYRNMTGTDNPQLPKISPEFGTMSIIPLPGGQGSVISSLILPQYPEGATSFAASVPFAGNGLALHNLDGDEFVASYTVVADEVGPADRTDEILNPSAQEDDEDTNDEDEDEDE
ncbi:MAG TPA: hypothetical protein VJ697_14435 [Nitrososphaeraceae archaeon]|nr:hypothetical protein [Nitrososphaeraceae archaeon]